MANQNKNNESKLEKKFIATKLIATLLFVHLIYNQLENLFFLKTIDYSILKNDLLYMAIFVGLFYCFDTVWVSLIAKLKGN